MEDLCKLKSVCQEIYRFEQELKNRLGLSINEALSLCLLSKSGEMSAGDISEEIGLSVTRMSRVLSSLEESGYVERRVSESDRRVMFFSLTKAGKRKADEMHRAEIKVPDFK